MKTWLCAIAAVFLSMPAIAAPISLLRSGNSPILTWGDSICNGQNASSFLIAPAYATPNALARYYYNGCVAGNTSSQIAARMFGAYAITIIEAGTNNFTSTSQILADISNMVSKVPNGEYLVWSVEGQNLPSFNCPSGVDYLSLQATNNAIANAYPNNFFDVETLMRNLAAPGGMFPDATAYAKCVPPAAALSDNLHPNNAGYTQINAAELALIQSKGW